METKKSWFDWNILFLILILGLILFAATQWESSSPQEKEPPMEYNLMNKVLVETGEKASFQLIRHLYSLAKEREEYPPITVREADSIVCHAVRIFQGEVDEEGNIQVHAVYDTDIPFMKLPSPYDYKQLSEEDRSDFPCRSSYSVVPGHDYNRTSLNAPFLLLRPKTDGSVSNDFIRLTETDKIYWEITEVEEGLIIVPKVKP